MKDHSIVTINFWGTIDWMDSLHPLNSMQNLVFSNNPNASYLKLSDKDTMSYM